MKKLLVVGLLLVAQNCYAAQENIQNNNARNWREKITEELNKPSTRYLLASGALIGAGIMLNNAVLPEQDSMAHTLLTDAIIALPVILGGYILSEKTDEGTRARGNSILKGFAAVYFGEFLQFNALRDCPLFSVEHRVSKDSDDFYSYQCTHPTDDGDKPCGVACIYAEITSLVFLAGAGAALRQSMVHRAEERNQHELLPDQMNINNQEALLLNNVNQHEFAPASILYQV